MLCWPFLLPASSSKRLSGGARRSSNATEAILHAIMAQVVDTYGPVVDGLENDIEEIEAQVFGGSAAVSRRVYELAREVIQFQRAADPLNDVLGALLRSEAIDVDPEVGRYLCDV
jgi:magnesium transporter